jgi:branched-chain amino acid transport system substrate-binding protein
MTAQLTKIKGLNPDGLFVETYVEQAAFIYRQANELGLKVPTFGFHGGSEEQFLRVLSSEQMEGVYDLRPTELTLAALGPGATRFAESYKKKFGESPAPNTGYAYDGIYILKAAIEKAGSVDVKKVIAAMASMDVPKDVILKYLPVDGKLFDQNGQAYITNGAFQWRNGKWTFVSELPSDTMAYSNALSAARASKNPIK